MFLVNHFRLITIQLGCVILVLLIPFARTVHSKQGLSDKEMGLINEAVQQIRTHSLAPPKSTRGMASDMLKTYTHTFDEYGDYLTSREYTAFLESTNSDYFGVQMDIQKKEGHIYLFPFKGGSAEKSGIKAGDELIAIDGSPVYGFSIFLIGSRIRGTEGATVQLIIRTGKGIPRVLTLRRQSTTYASVTFETFDKANYIQIGRFTKNTEKRLIETIGKNEKTIVIDLRRNQGGSLRIARKCADLFLAPDKIVFRLRYRDEIMAITAEKAPLTNSLVVLLQGKNTASAAEAFICALTDNGRAISVGRKSYGKGLAQRFLPLSDGSALLLTYAEILTPDNKAYNKLGLEPDFHLPEKFMEQEFTDNKSIAELIHYINSQQE